MRAGSDPSVNAAALNLSIPRRFDFISCSGPLERQF